MSKFYAALVTAFLFAPAVHAADAKMSAADIKTNLEAAASDAGKVRAYCAMSKKMDEVGDDEKKAEAAGDDFENAWDAGQDAADGTPEAKAMDEAMTTLDAKCK